MEKHLLREIIQIVKYRFNLEEDKASDVELHESIKKAVEFKGMNIWTLIFAIFIASIGLNVNSTAVIIGAMLISPLMGPIMGVGMGAGVFDFELIKKASKNLFIATIVGLVTSTIYFLISPINHAQSEILARTSPTIYDVLIAFFGGLAGIVASTRRKYNNVIPGVAIATALMPPLCTAGYGLATGQLSYFFSAFYLYLINSVFISISTFLMVRFLKYRPVNYVNPETAKKVRKWVLWIALFTIFPSVFLAYYFIRNEMFIQNANRLLNEELSATNCTVISKKIQPEKKQILITIIGNVSADSVKQLVQIKKESYDLEDATILVQNSLSENGTQPNVNELKDGIIETLFIKQEEKLKTQNEEITTLKKQLLNQESFEIKKKETIQEFYALYGKPDELIIEKSIRHGLDAVDTTLLVYIKSNSFLFKRNELIKIKNWLEVKFHIKKIKVIKD